MTTKNPYRKNSHLSVGKSRRIIKFFCEDLTASKTSKLLGIERKTINSWYDYMRQAVFWVGLAKDKEIWNLIVEIDESYFGPKRIRGKRGKGAGNKIKVLGLLKRQGKVFVQVVPDCSANSLMPIIRGKVNLDSTLNTDDENLTIDG